MEKGGNDGLTQECKLDDIWGKQSVILLEKQKDLYRLRW